MNPYEVLGVRADASADDIHRAYVALARRFHPDRHLDEAPAARAVAEDRMREVNEAWSMLGDAVRRTRHDAETPRPFQPFEIVDDEPDPRDQPDVPYRPAAPPTGGERARTMAPVLLFAASIFVGAMAIAMDATGGLALAFVLFLLSCVGFLVIPLLALGKARRDEG